MSNNQAIQSRSKKQNPIYQRLISQNPIQKLFEYPIYWAECFGIAPFLPTTRLEMDQLGWDSCDVIIVTGDAYVDHPSFGMAVIGRLLEAQGFRVGIIAQPQWQNKNDFMQLGRPNLFFGVTAGNMDSMINRYTADRKLRHDDAYTPNGKGGKRPDRAALVYSQRCKEAYSDVPLILGGIEASLRRLAHYDYWSDKIRRSILIDAKADMLLFGNAERALVAVAHHLASNRPLDQLIDLAGTAIVKNIVNKEIASDYHEIDRTRVDGFSYEFVADIYQKNNQQSDFEQTESQLMEQIPYDALVNSQSTDDLISYHFSAKSRMKSSLILKKSNEVIRLPSFEKLQNDRILYAHASRQMHQQNNPYSAKPLVQRHGTRDLWINPPPIPLTSEEMDYVFALPYQRRPHPSYGHAKIPAYEMIKTSVNIMRGCFGGCSFCSITEHEGRIIQSRSKQSILDEIMLIKQQVPGFTGVISDLGGPTANMYQLNCIDPKAQQNCCRASCVYPKICAKLNTDHQPLIELYREARQLIGIKKIVIASGVRYDLALESPEYIKELVTHHVGGYLKVAPEHTEPKTLSLMMKPPIDRFYQFKQLFEKYSKQAGKEQYLIPYFIAAHPGCDDNEMVNLAIWLKENNFRCDQVQNFYPSPMCHATTMYHTQINPLIKVSYKRNSPLPVAKGIKQRRLHKALLRYHAPENWQLLHDALITMGRQDLIGDDGRCLIPSQSPFIVKSNVKTTYNRFVTKGVLVASRRKQ